MGRAPEPAEVRTAGRAAVERLAGAPELERPEEGRPVAVRTGRGAGSGLRCGAGVLSSDSSGASIEMNEASMM